MLAYVGEDTTARDNNSGNTTVWILSKTTGPVVEDHIPFPCVHLIRGRWRIAAVRSTELWADVSSCTDACEETANRMGVEVGDHNPASRRRTTGG
jgi:hypothetical protein